MNKDWTQSATVWFNVVMAFIMGAPELINQIVTIIPPQYEALHARLLWWAGAITIGVNWYRRVYKTNTPIAAPLAPDVVPKPVKGEGGRFVSKQSGLGIIALFLLLPALGRTQENPGTSVEGILSIHGKFSAVVTHRIGSFHDVLGRRSLDLEVRPFAGVNLSNSGALTGGMVLAFATPIKLAAEARLSIGVFGQATISRKFDAGLYFGIAWTLGK